MRIHTALAILAASFMATPALASGLDFKLINDTGYAIGKVYVDPASSDSWSDNILDVDELGDGASADVTFSGDPDSCKWDIKVDWVGDYEPVVWKDLNLCNISEITLQYDQEKDETTAVVK